MKIHPTFHISLLELYKDSLISGIFRVLPSLIEIEGKKEFEVSKILNLRITQRELEYFIYWLGYDINERTWEPVANFSNASELIQEFHCWYPEKLSFKDAWIQYIWTNTSTTSKF
jgi:hypothetical protein